MVSIFQTMRGMAENDKETGEMKYLSKRKRFEYQHLSNLEVGLHFPEVACLNLIEVKHLLIAIKSRKLALEIEGELINVKMKESQNE